MPKTLFLFLLMLLVLPVWSQTTEEEEQKKKEALEQRKKAEIEKLMQDEFMKREGSRFTTLGRVRRVNGSLSANGNSVIRNMKRTYWILPATPFANSKIVSLSRTAVSFVSKERNFWRNIRKRS
jgi:hypothetical protein